MTKSLLPLCLAVVLSLTGCANLRLRNPPPPQAEAQVQMPGMPGVRAWGDEFSPVFQQDIVESIRQEKRLGLFQEGDAVSILAISGGGGDGAFGAGLLCGWTASGTRPSFKLVTGISTGALTAPFAFLGPAYDDRLRKAYTTISSEDIFKLKSLFGMLVGLFRSDAIALTDPLANLTTEFVDEQMLRDVAAEHAKGRRLYIGTTALDAQRPVIWNMGAIAASSHPQALELFRRVMIASAAIPVVFPPVYFKVQAGEKTFDEMHVDGGVLNQVFLYGSALDPLQGMKELGFERMKRNFSVYVIRNTQIRPGWQRVRPLVRSIGTRSVSSLIKAQGIGDLFRIFTTSQRDGFDFNMASIPEELDTADRAEEFDNRVMNILFDAGYKQARQGYRWRTTPPGFYLADQEGASAQ